MTSRSRTLCASVAAVALGAVSLLSTAPTLADVPPIQRLTNGDADSGEPVLAAHGETAVFSSHADDLPGAEGASIRRQIFTTDIAAGTFARLTSGNNDSLNPDISPTGNWVVFDSFASNLVAGDTNGQRDVFRLHIPSGALDRVTDGDGPSFDAKVADDGTVVFVSDASDLMAVTDTDNQPDVFVWDGAITTLATDDLNYLYYGAEISGDGSTIAFVHEHPDGDPNHPYGDLDVYVADVDGTNRVLVTAAGNYPSDRPGLSYDGSTLAFRSAANSLPNAPGGIGRNVLVWTGGVFTRVSNSNDESVLALSLSEDGSTVAFATAADLLADGNNEVNIFLSGTDGTGLERRTFDNATNPSLDEVGSVVVYEWLAGAITDLEMQDDDASPPTTSSTTSSSSTTSTSTTTTQPPVTDPPTTEPPITEPDRILSTSYQEMTGVDGRIARLYAAFFLRDPDSAGFQFWQTRIASGQWTNDDAARFFSESPEFVATYGSGLTDAEFIDLLYNNTLGRTPDAGGLAYWLGQLESGTTRGSVALGFSDAPEFRTRTNTN